MENMIHMKRNALALAMGGTLLLTACGGGGGGGNSPSNSGATTSSMSGVASKGLILNGLASAYRVNADGTKGALLQQVRTNASTGAYSFTGLPAGVSVLVEVTGVPGETTMKDEATGGTLNLDSSFKLRAATVTGNSGTVALQVTPYSEMAVTLAEASGGLSADNVQKANQKVVAFAGEDVINVAPSFDASGKALNAAAVKLAAVSQLASSGTVGAATCAGSTLDKVKCAVTQLAQQGLSSDAVVSSLQAAETTIKADVNKVSTEAANSVQPVEKQTAGLPSGAAQTSIQTARSLIQSLRNLGTSLGSQAPGSLRTRVQTIDQATSALPDVLPSSLLDGLDVLARASELLNRSIDNGLVLQVNDVYRIKGTHCRVASATSVDCRRILSFDGSAAKQFRVQLSVANAAAHTYSAVSSIVQQPGNYDPSGFVGSGSPTTITSQFNATVTRPSDAATTQVMNGELPLGLSGQNQVINGKAVVNLSLQTVDNANATTRYNLNGTLTQRASGVNYTSLTLNTGSYLEEASTGVTNTVAMHLDLQADVVNASNTGFRFNGVLDTSAYLPRRQDNLPGTVAFNGRAFLLESGEATQIFQGQLRATGLIDENGDAATTGRAATVSLSLFVPELNRTVSIALTNFTEGANGAYTFTGTFNDGVNAVSFAGRDLSGETDDYLDLRVGDVQARLTPANLRSTIALVRNGSSEVVGSYDTNKSQVTFSDGSYERF